MKQARLLCLALSLAASVAVAADSAMPPRAPGMEVRPGATLLTFPAAALPGGADTAAAAPALGAVVALPANATTARATLVSGTARAVSVGDRIMRQRGRPVVFVTVEEPGSGAIVVSVAHDGDWHGKADDRLASPALTAGLAGVPELAGKSAAHPLGGSYVIVTTPAFLQPIEPLVAWKTQKGWPVAVVTTDEIGNTGLEIQAWLREAYQTWSRPPEYVLLVGDVDHVPTFFIGGNVTDLPFALLDGDDWLPDVMVGRFAVENASQCAVMVAKTVHYEREPYLDQTAWFTRGVMIGGQYGSTTPMYTVRYCGEQLQRIGFSPLVPVTPVQLQGNYIVSPYIPQDQVGVPNNMGPQVINPSIDEGCSMVVYRGWAYGTGGWFSPTYQVANVQTLANGAMLPVVFSFVCHTGNFNANTPCMGEVFTRLGGSEPAQFRGAVAFYGNGEPWSRTRYNDAMALSTFERIIEPQLTTLGSLVNAGKMRFMEFFPSAIDESGDGFSVEFYFHIYNLMGDPELNYWRAQPTPMDVAHAASVPVGTTVVDVAVADDGGGAPLEGARIGVVQAGALLGAGLTGPDGAARVVLDEPVGDGPVSLCVTRPGRLAYLATLNAELGSVYLSLTSLAVTDDQGEAAAATPAAALELVPTMRNLGAAPSAEASLALTVTGPATITTGTTSVPPLAGGASAPASAPLRVTVAADAADGAVIDGFVAAAHDAQTDHSAFELRVQAPEILVTADGQWLEPGTTQDLTLTVRNLGSLPTAGGTLEFSLSGPDGVVVLTSELAFAALAARDGRQTIGPLTLQLAASLAAGGTVNIRVEASCAEGAVQVSNLPVAIGRGDVTEPSGPDAYGYFAYDSADYLYPDQRPVYRWREISTAFGGDGTKLPFTTNNYDRRVRIDLPFTFRFYGQDFARIRVSDNGWISFDAENDFYNFYNWPIPLAHGNGALVAPFWDNLTPEPFPFPEDDPVGVDSDGIYWLYDEPAGELIVEWSRMRHVYSDTVPELQTFQAVLRDPAVHATTPTGDGEILFFYRQIADNDHLRMYATVGIESPDETDGLQLTYDNVRARGFAPLGPGMAVRLTTSPPVRVPLLVDAFERRQAADTAHLTWSLSDPRPVIGWRLHAVGAGGRVCLTPTNLPAEARGAVVAVDAGCEVVLEALLPFGGACDAGKALAASADLRFALAEPQPNPMRGQTVLSFAIPRDGAVRLRVFDVRGRCVATVLDGRAEAGAGVVVWQGRDDRGRQLADGLYLLRLEHGGEVLTRKLLLVR